VLGVLLLGCDSRPQIEEGVAYEEYVELAKQHTARGEHEKAILAYEKALTLKPEDGETHHLIGELYYWEHQASYNEARRRLSYDLLTSPKKKGERIL
jgi:tetratricopeptide (TPR) repeat protein